MKVLLAILALFALMACSTGPTGSAVLDDTINEVGGWCDEGSDWSWMADGKGSAKMEVQGIIESGKYKGLCHITFSVESTDGQMNMDYYISEDEETGYVEMEMPNGQTVTQEWTK